MFNYKKILFGLLTVFAMNQALADIKLYNETGGEIIVMLLDGADCNFSVEYHEDKYNHHTTSSDYKVKINPEHWIVISDKDVEKTMAISFDEKTFYFNEYNTELHNNVTYNIKKYIEEPEPTIISEAGERRPIEEILFGHDDVEVPSVPVAAAVNRRQLESRPMPVPMTQLMEQEESDYSSDEIMEQEEFDDSSDEPIAEDFSMLKSRLRSNFSVPNLEISEWQYLPEGLYRPLAPASVSWSSYLVCQLIGSDSHELEQRTELGNSKEIKKLRDKKK